MMNSRSAARGPVRRRIFVGNLPWNWQPENLEKLFAPFGTVHWVALQRDPETERSRGFGFVEMDEEVARKAIDKLDGTKHGGRLLRVNLARPRPSRD